MDKIYSLINNNEVFDKISDIARIVDPLHKKVLEIKNDEINFSSYHCFDFWCNDKICDNCISIRAYNNSETYVKIEYTKDKAFMITAIPYNLPDRRVVIEILKDITNSIIFDAADWVDSNEINAIHSLIDSMNKLAFCDDLTGLYNRRYIMEKLPVDLLNNSLLKTEMCVIMMDIDYFKIVNDTHGHLAGDVALKKIADIISGCIRRSNDWIARFGGEEFFICMPGADIETAISTTELMRKSIENAAIMYNDNEIKLTASFGIHNLKSSDAQSVDELLKHADQKMYLAKNNGRNRVEF